MAPCPTDPESRYALRRRIRRLLAAGRPQRRLRPLDLLLLTALAGHLLGDTLVGLHAGPGRTCEPAAFHRR
jgi:hypothetical protein